jgi:hypothetical protein
MIKAAERTSVNKRERCASQRQVLGQNFVPVNVQKIAFCAANSSSCLAGYPITNRAAPGANISASDWRIAASRLFVDACGTLMDGYLSSPENNTLIALVDCSVSLYPDLLFHPEWDPLQNEPSQMGAKTR